MRGMMAYYKAAQVRYRFLVDIRTGLLKPGDRVDSIRMLCSRYHTCLATMTKVLSQLKEEGILEVSQGRATRIRKRPEKRITLFYSDKMEIGESPFWSAFYRGICKVLDPLTEFMLFLCNVDTTSDDVLLHILEEGDSGFLIAGSFGDHFRFSERFWKLIRKQKIPHVILFPEAIGYRESPVVCNDFMPAYLSVLETLKSRGASNPLLIGEYEWNTGNWNKFLSFTDAYEKVFGKPFRTENYLQALHRNILFVYENVMRRLRSDDPPDCFMMFSDSFAPPVIRACHDVGKMLPLCGCDNLPIASMTIPSLSSIELSREEIGRKAAELLLEQIRAPRDFSPKTWTIPAYPVYRDSLSPIKKHPSANQEEP